MRFPEHGEMSSSPACTPAPCLHNTAPLVVAMTIQQHSSLALARQRLGPYPPWAVREKFTSSDEKGSTLN